MLQLRLGDEGGAGAAGEHEDVEPARMVGEEDDVALDRSADIASPRPADVSGTAEKPARPARGQAKQPPQAMPGKTDDESEDEPRDPEADP
ncbi:hypothetical protein ACFO8O_13225 [Hephaestia sp. GCM10023244]